MAETFPKSGILTSDVFATFDVAKPQVSEFLTSRYGKQFMPFMDKFRKMGREEGIQSDTWYNYEDNWIHETITLTADATAIDGGASKKGALLTIDTTNGFYPRVGDMITVPGTLNQAWVSAIDVANSQLTIVPAIASVNLLASGTTLVNGAELAITSGAFAEQTDQPAGTVGGMVKRTFQMQIIKETVGAAGSQLINEQWVRLFDDGRNVIGYYNPGLMRAEEILKLKIDGALTVGQQSTNTGASGYMRQKRVNRWGSEETTYADVKTTKGFIPIITELGNTQTYGAAGTFAITDFDDECFYMRSQAVASGAIYGGLGDRLFADIQEELKDYFIDQTGDGALLTSVISVMGKGKKEMAADLNFRYVHRNNFSFGLDVVESWSHPKYLGVTGYNMGSKGMFIPLKQVLDPKSNVMVDNMVIKYRANQTYNRRAEIWTTGGAGEMPKTSSVDLREYFWRTEIGMGLVAANQMTWVTNG